MDLRIRIPEKQKPTERRNPALFGGLYFAFRASVGRLSEWLGLAHTPLTQSTTLASVVFYFAIRDNVDRLVEA